MLELSKQIKLEQGLKDIWKDVDQLPKLSKAGTFFQAFIRACRSIILNPLVSLITIFTAGIALFLLGASILIIQNLNSKITTSQSSVPIYIYLKDDTSQEKIYEMTNKLESSSEVVKVIFRDKAFALEQFRNSLGEDKELVSGFDKENSPLPVSLEIQLNEKNSTPESYEKIVKEYQKKDVVDAVIYEKGLISELSSIAEFFNFIGIVGVCAMLLVVGFIIASTISLALYAHKAEIEVMQLVGAPQSDMQRPYIIEGCLQGFAASVFGILCLSVVFSTFKESILKSELIKNLASELHFLSFWSILLILFVGVVISAISSYAATLGEK